jgi:hypothetical protein
MFYYGGFCVELNFQCALYTKRSSPYNSQFIKIFNFSGCKERNFLYQGNDIKEVKAVNEQDCQDKCKLEPGCFFWTWWKKMCQLKHFGALQNRTQQQGAVSGTAICPGKSKLNFHTISAFVKIHKSAICNNST